MFMFKVASIVLDLVLMELIDKLKDSRCACQVKVLNFVTAESGKSLRLKTNEFLKHALIH